MWLGRQRLVFQGIPKVDIEADCRSDDTTRGMSNVETRKRAEVANARASSSFEKEISCLLRMGVDAETEKGTKF